MGDRPFPVLDPSLQVLFHYRLQTIRKLYLRDALAEAVTQVALPALDAEPCGLVDGKALNRTASFGVRGEVVFPVPILLTAAPFLLGYYRLLYGLSQKEFYTKGPFGRFKKMEDDGKVPSAVKELVLPMCQSLIGTGQRLVEALDTVSLDVIHELQLLTVGPQLRGSENTRIGQSATREVRELVLEIVRAYVRETTERTLILRNEPGRVVLVEFFADPDIRITEQLPSGIRPTLSIEIKGGQDASNIHNRLGEAEKSHQKAKNKGFFEFWTILRVDTADETARRASPTTSRFFNLDRICNLRTPEHAEFRELLSSLIGLRSAT